MAGRQLGSATTLVVAFLTVLGGCATPDTSPRSDGMPPPSRHTDQSQGSTLREGGSDDSAGAATCAQTYRPAAVAQRAFAFDGTVTDVGDGPNDLGSVAVTFEVREWFHGGSRKTVRVDLAPPSSSQLESSIAGGTYGVGSRLLVSGEPRWGGRPLDHAVAWGCGFTRLYDPSTAASWRQPD